MFKAMNKYYEINFDKIIEMKEMIIKENIELTCINSDGISIIIPGTAVNVLLEQKDNALIKGAKFYISSFSTKFFNLNNPQTNKSSVIDGTDENKYGEFEYFYHIYKNCISNNNEKLKTANNDLLSKIVKERVNNRLYLLKPNLDQLKLESKAPKVTSEIAVNIERLLTGMGIIGRLDFIRHLKYIKSASIKRNDIINTETEIMISSIMNAIVTYLEKEYFYRDIFDNLDMLDDSNILSHSNRVCILMIEFLYYYNKIFNKGLSSKLRQDYKSIYLEKYRTILSRFNISKSIEKLENVFRLGIRKFTGSEIVSYATGAFYHDVAMLNMTDFVPTDDFIKDGDFKDFHTAKAYYFLKYVLNQKDEASLIVGLHHECYGYGSGILKNFMDKKVNDPKHKVDFLMSFETDDIINADVLAYFPAKMFEVVDIYDTLSFMEGRRNKNPQEVALFMKKMFTENKIAVDPIILDLFIQFLSDVKGIEVIEE
ncbi:hypothetical protein [Brachyspira hampsonii]|uniref:Uncharacterized protein n=1 Tax=Brachyspira hampsonii 30446 TaxID=1289135 RepID=A0A2U4EY22_9SPIR|nr:hypothetical protein [Brachyspira hampsonii]EKV56222.1 hypothetical protein A966_11082 [Brachyspira hampsonii 30446]MBW5389255.1 hypothetical protein [Brachyspira hampsonii]MBW5394817.1 hypothetical protein [Brachyspira hampsonii]OEJ20774.1 hypothetical protein A9495_10350 [Brachyspira hampsonii]